MNHASGPCFLIAFALIAGVTAIPMSAQSVPDSIAGNWKVARWYAPGIHAMDTKVAATWIGKHARFAPSAARFDSERCDRPIYNQKAVEAGAWFVEGFRIQAESLGFDERSKIIVIDLSCGDPDNDWTAPGGTLIIKDRTHVLTVWDGVFFELTRP